MSKSTKPITDEQAWDFTSNTIRLLSLSVVQIRSILNDGGESVGDLTDSFVSIIQALDEMMKKYADDDETQHEFKHIHAKIQQGIVAFQFYDRISQRLEHVSNSLHRVGDVIGCVQDRHDPDCWHALQHDIKAKYTMESERVVFDHIMSGSSVEEALQAYKNHQARSAPDDEVELF